jgi:hypothetical protein
MAAIKEANPVICVIDKHKLVTCHPISIIIVLREVDILKTFLVTAIIQIIQWNS